MTLPIKYSAFPPTLPSRKTCFMQRISYDTPYNPLSWPTLLHWRRYYGNVTCMDMADWMLNTMCCHVSREKHDIGKCWIFYLFILVQFSFSCITRLYITAKKTDGPCSPLCFMHYKILVCWGLYSTNVCTILPNVLSVPTWAEVTRQFRWLYSRFRVPAWGKTVFTFL
jgi:hypothetical protein